MYLKQLALLLFFSIFISACSSDSDDPPEENLPIGQVTDSDPADNQLSENAVNGDAVGITAMAIDTTASDTVSYALTDDDDGRFAIDTDSGTVTVADDTKLDYESDALHSIGIMATSSDGSTSTGTMDITVFDETFASGGDNDMMIEIVDSETFEEDLLTALITAPSESIIMLPAGTFDLTRELSVSTDKIILRGRGMGQGGGLLKADGFVPRIITNLPDASAESTILRFDTQVGSQSLSVTGDSFIIEDLAIENSPGDAIKITGTNGSIIRRVRVEWTNGADENNGAYGLYPVQTSNVLIEDSVVRGASDAGVYVGQSTNIIVRRNFVYENVAGIEIENSTFADVFDNETTANTGGILVFDLPGPTVQGGEATRVFNNQVYSNNTQNFAPQGNIVGTVPTGTGIMIMANDDIEVFDNVIEDNISVGAIVVSYYIVDSTISKPTYDPVPEKIYFHDNEFINNSTDPQALTLQIASIFAPANNGKMVDIFYDSSGVGLQLGLLKEFPDGLAPSQRICAQNNGSDTSIGSINALVALGGLPFDPAFTIDPNDFDCAHASLPAIVLDPIGTSEGDEGIIVDAEALCSAQVEGVNAQAFVADCAKLSDYNLFAEKTQPRQDANGNGVLYDLTTPLFSDYANKYRFLFVPDGLTAAYRDNGSMEFPIGTIISKTFAIQADLRDSESAEKLIETRLLIKRTEGWIALPYIWDADKADASLAVIGGTDEISWTDINGQLQTTMYAIPNKNQCITCHGVEGSDSVVKIHPLGPKASLLNKDTLTDGTAINQLTLLTDLGLLVGAPEDKSTIDTIPDFTDTNASLDDRARGYLDINCASCHSGTGFADTSGLFLDYRREFGLDTGECKPPVAAGDGAGDLSYSIVPGDADKSILAFRMDSNEPDIRMPELGRSVIHTEGLALITEWINAMEPNNCGA